MLTPSREAVIANLCSLGLTRPTIEHGFSSRRRILEDRLISYLVLVYLLSKNFGLMIIFYLQRP